MLCRCAEGTLAGPRWIACTSARPCQGPRTQLKALSAQHGSPTSAQPLQRGRAGEVASNVISPQTWANVSSAAGAIWALGSARCAVLGASASVVGPETLKKRLIF